MDANYAHIASNVVTRLKSALKIKTNLELAEVMNIAPNTISSWTKRESIPFLKLIAICDKYRISLDWLVGFKENATEVQEPESTYQKPDERDQLLIKVLQKNIELLEDRLKKTEQLLQEAEKKLELKEMELASLRKKAS